MQHVDTKIKQVTRVYSKLRTDDPINNMLKCMNEETEKAYFVTEHSKLE